MTTTLTAPQATVARSRVWQVVAQLARFAGVGTAGMALYLGLYAVGSQVTDDTLANVAAWLVSTLATNQVHRSLTFGVHGKDGLTADQTVSLVTSLVALGVSTLILDQATGMGLVAEMVVLVAVNVAVGLMRFALMRWWLVGHRHAAA